MGAFDRDVKVGDTVVVDKDLHGGGYEAEIVWLGKLFARIRVESEEWDIMRNRLWPKEASK